jgi:hypothetical protein
MMRVFEFARFCSKQLLKRKKTKWKKIKICQWFFLVSASHKKMTGSSDDLVNLLDGHCLDAFQRSDLVFKACKTIEENQNCQPKSDKPSPFKNKTELFQAINEIKLNCQFLSELQQRIFVLLIFTRDEQLASELGSIAHQQFTELATQYLSGNLSGEHFFVKTRTLICKTLK